VFSWIFRLLTGPSSDATDLREMPPPVPFRCGTMLLDADLEARSAILRAWQEADDRYIAWVNAHPLPKAGWLEEADRLRNRRSSN
jgi:hypothetical protein